jgi:uncharacterized OB-fold protein
LPSLRWQDLPPRDVCPHCGSDARTTSTFSGRGKIFSFTTISDAPAGFEHNAPYTVALVQLDEGPVVTAQLTDLDGQEVKIGDAVEMVTRKIKDDGNQRGIILYGYKFRPAVARSMAAAD